MDNNIFRRYIVKDEFGFKLDYATVAGEIPVPMKRDLIRDAICVNCLLCEDFTKQVSEQGWSPCQIS